MSCVVTQTTDQYATYNEDSVVVYVNGTIIKNRSLVSSTKTSAAATVNEWYEYWIGRPADKEGLEYWILDAVNSGRGLAATESVFRAAYEAKEALLGGIANVYTFCEWLEVEPQEIPNVPTMGKPISATNINSILLDRSPFKRISLSQELGDQLFVRPDSTGKFNTVKLPAIGQPISFGQLDGLGRYVIPYPTPLIQNLSQATTYQNVNANTGDKNFSISFNVDWRFSEWPETREQDANDTFRFKVTLKTYKKEGSGSYQLVNTQTIKNTTTRPESSSTAYVYTRGISTAFSPSSLTDSLEVKVKFEVIAELLVQEFSDQLGGVLLPEEQYVSSDTSLPGSMTLIPFQLGDDDKGDVSITSNDQVFGSAIVYKRAIDDTIALGRAEVYEGKFTATTTTAPGRNPSDNLEIEWQYQPTTEGSQYVDNDITDLIDTADGTVRYVTDVPPNATAGQVNLEVDPISSRWNGWQFRFRARNEISLSNPAETIYTDWKNSEGPNLVIEYNLKQPEYVLPPNLTVDIAKGFTSPIPFHTFWTGEGTKTYYWNITEVQRLDLLAPISVWNTVQGEVDNVENTFLSPGDPAFNISYIDMDSKESLSNDTLQYRLNIWANSDYTGLLASTVFNLKKFFATVEFTGVKVGTSLITIVDGPPPALQHFEGSAVQYFGRANYYTLPGVRELRWRYTVTTDVDDPADALEELEDGVGNPYYPDTIYTGVQVVSEEPPFFNVGSGALDGNNLAKSWFQLPKLYSIQDSQGGGTIGNKEYITISLLDDQNQVVDEAFLQVADRIEDGFLWTSSPVAPQSAGSETFNKEYYVKTFQGSIGFGGLPYRFRNDNNTFTLDSFRWEKRALNGGWGAVAQSTKYSYQDITGAIQSGSRISTVEDGIPTLTWTDFPNNKKDTETWRVTAKLINNENGLVSYISSDPVDITFGYKDTTLYPGIVYGYILPQNAALELAGDYILEGRDTVEVVVVTWDVPKGSIINYALTDNAEVLPNDNLWRSLYRINTIQPTGQLVAKSNNKYSYEVHQLPGWILNETSQYPELAHYTPEVTEGIQFTMDDQSYANSPNYKFDSSFVSPRNRSPLGLNQAEWATAETFRWDISVGTRFQQLLNSVTGGFDKSGTTLFMPDELSAQNWPVVLQAMNVTPEAQAEQWYLLIEGDVAVRYFDTTATNYSNAYHPKARGYTFSALEFNNDASKPRKKKDGRYEMSASFQSSGQDLVTTDSSGTIGIAYKEGARFRYIWQKKFKIINTYEAPPVVIGQLGVTSGQVLEVDEGQSVTFTVYDRSRFETAYKDYTAIPEGTTIYCKVQGDFGFRFQTIGNTGNLESDFYTTPAPTIEQNGKIQVVELTMGADGKCNPLYVELVDDGFEDEADPEKFRVKAALEAGDIQTSGKFVVSQWVAVNDVYEAPYVSLDDAHPGWYVDVNVINNTHSADSTATYSARMSIKDAGGNSINLSPFNNTDKTIKFNWEPSSLINPNVGSGTGSQFVASSSGNAINYALKGGLVLSEDETLTLTASRKSDGAGEGSDSVTIKSNYVAPDPITNLTLAVTSQIPVDNVIRKGRGDFELGELATIVWEVRYDGGSDDVTYSWNLEGNYQYPQYSRFNFSGNTQPNNKVQSLVLRLIEDFNQKAVGTYTSYDGTVTLTATDNVSGQQVVTSLSVYLGIAVLESLRDPDPRINPREF